MEGAVLLLRLAIVDLSKVSLFRALVPGLFVFSDAIGSLLSVELSGCCAETVLINTKGSNATNAAIRKK